jgi:hypothetical protein
MTNDLTATAIATHSEDAAVFGPVSTHGQLPIGRRERQHGSLSTLVDIRVTAVVETADDLAIADRVAYVIARRTSTTCLVIATAHTFVIAQCDTNLVLADAATIRHTHGNDRIVTIATPDGLAPILEPVHDLY